ncbi:hypothetical protein [Angelakisella massiliensis]|uniref:hypothetical protein n=1 Tax=Angelakisella massiliensis TaxID=1871018 RepID=UPI00155EE0AA|nr:hypothetical protein [Angelakisella massiliensis]
MEGRKYAAVMMAAGYNWPAYFFLFSLPEQEIFLFYFVLWAWQRRDYEYFENNDKKLQ